MGSAMECRCCGLADDVTVVVASFKVVRECRLFCGCAVAVTSRRGPELASDVRPLLVVDIDVDAVVIRIPNVTATSLRVGLESALAVTSRRRTPLIPLLQAR